MIQIDTDSYIVLGQKYRLQPKNMAGLVDKAKVDETRVKQISNTIQIKSLMKLRRLSRIKQ